MKCDNCGKEWYDEDYFVTFSDMGKTLCGQCLFNKGLRDKLPKNIQEKLNIANKKYTDAKTKNLFD